VRIILLAALALVVSCSSSSSYNETTFPYSYDQTNLINKTPKKVILAPVNLGVPTPSYLAKAERKTKAMVRDYLKSNGFEILPDYLYENAWQKAIRTYGNVYDPSTGKIDVNAWRGAMITVGEVLREQSDADLIIYADLIDHDVQHSNGMQHYARWYGVTRKPALQGSGTGVPMDFEWTQRIKAASLLVSIYDINLNPVFASRGGIDTLYAINMKSSNPVFVRRKKLLSNDSYIEEGIEIAFHPFIKMKGYPGKEIEPAAAATTTETE